MPAVFPSTIWALLRDQGRLVGAAYAYPDTGASWLVGFTGVVPQERGRGFARALKSSLHVAAARRGATSIGTINEEGNAAIRGLNASLGYEPVAVRVRLRRPAGSSPGDHGRGSEPIRG